MREIILDTETTGLDPSSGHRIIEIGCVEIFKKIKTGKIFHFYLNPERDVPLDAFKIHGISTEFLKDKPKFKDIYKDFLNFIEDSTLVIHNAPFDMKFINYELSIVNSEKLKHQIVDTLLLARRKYPGSPASLDSLCKRFEISLANRTKHGALLDSELLYEVYINLLGIAQSELTFTSEPKSVEAEKIIVEAIKTIEKRNFDLTDQEKALHKKMLEKIPNNLWSKLDFNK